jgi:hypothetical protein
MAQLNDLLVAGPSQILGNVNIGGNLNVSGTISVNNQELSSIYLTQEYANKTYIYGSVSGNTLTLIIPS